MAVQKSRKSHSKVRMRRAHSALNNAALSIDVTSGERHRRHHLTKEGYYRGIKVIGSSDEE